MPKGMSPMSEFALDKSLESGPNCRDAFVSVLIPRAVSSYRYTLLSTVKVLRTKAALTKLACNMFLSFNVVALYLNLFLGRSVETIT